MKKWTPLLLLATLLLLTLGCSKKHGPEPIVIPKDATKMEVSFTWAGIDTCTHDSPEIQVTRVPAGTVELQVRLKDTNEPAWNHGGGKVAYDGSGTISAGALNRGYNGPCPPWDQSHKYEFSVMAVDDQGTIIGFGKARQLFPPKN
ncbi:phospholipid-binding protein [Desulfosarcina ovata]|uniref:Phospholipid-binding protein n=1 Tax=Desulfosarcina ovata subsp. ovata TaxID=2752305 RepID=A0A5K8AE43_9BACT|nr:phospholipid-binding protein [Desulfosarcina ovata]BBO90953.1 hypothetical protein DSCOOX_41330 [Desulfosarcina ovata subsp. ovata]